MLDMVFNVKASNHGACNIVRQSRFLGSVLARLDKDASSVLADLAAFRDRLVQPRNLLFVAVANFFKLTVPLKRLLVERFLPARFGKGAVARIEHVPMMHQYHSDAVKTPKGQVTIVGMPIDSSFLLMSAPGPKTFLEPDLAALDVLTEYLTTSEGVFWKKIRGLGLAYGYGIWSDIEHGLMYFSLDRSGSLAKAFEESHKIIKRVETEPLQEVQLEAARSSVVFSVIDGVETAADAANAEFLRRIQGLPAGHDKEYLAAVQRVTLDDLRRVLRRWIVPMFDIDKTNVAIAAPSDKTKQIAKAFKAWGRPVTVFNEVDKAFK